MKFTPTPIDGAYLIDIEPFQDTRGFFSRVYCNDQFSALNLETVWLQCSISFNRRQGTLRGLHYQIAPHEETKQVRCTRGAIFDVIVDLRPQSSTFGHHFSVTLTEDNRRTLYIPAGLAHGFQTLVDDTEVYYQISARYVPEAARGICWNDPALGIEWPITAPIMNDRDKTFPNFNAILDSLAEQRP